MLYKNVIKAKGFTEKDIHNHNPMRVITSMMGALHLELGGES